MKSPEVSVVEEGAEALDDLLTMLGVDPKERPEHGGPTTAEVLAKAVIDAFVARYTDPDEVDPLDEMERDSLTVWGKAFSAQARDYGDPPRRWSLLFHVMDGAPLEQGDVRLGPGDVAKLRELLNEMEARA